jgi:hypothetical protein
VLGVLLDGCNVEVQLGHWDGIMGHSMMEEAAGMYKGLLRGGLAVR